MRWRQCKVLRTSTASKMVNTKYSESEFFHPTITPGWGDRRAFDGQNSRMSLSVEDMASCLHQNEPRRRSCSRAEMPPPVERGCCSASQLEAVEPTELVDLQSRSLAPQYVRWAKGARKRRWTGRGSLLPRESGRPLDLSSDDHAARAILTTTP